MSQVLFAQLEFIWATRETFNKLQSNEEKLKNSDLDSAVYLSFLQKRRLGNVSTDSFFV